MSYRPTQKDQEEAIRMMKENLLIKDDDLPLCWGKQETCENIGTHIIPEKHGLFCVDCFNKLVNN